MSDTGFGLWVGTSVNDTSSVIAAGYAFSDAAGALATIVKIDPYIIYCPHCPYLCLDPRQKESGRWVKWRNG